MTLRHDAVLVLQGAGDLPRELVVQAIDQVADVIRHVADVQPFAAAIAGIENLLEILQAADDLVVVRQRAVAEVVDRAGRFVAGDDPVGQPRKLLFEANVGSHGGRTPAEWNRAQNWAGRCVLSGRKKRYQPRRH